ncbi:B12-binding domain-containing radical SAM protein [Nocardia anaemiae]|uniref:B12-binding domain-containing radical SAM protein n=1 Tax=Nocardia anaemiae TaxID=263910 RepID=UPI001471EB3D|nr:radical SAM protein [Nocardia anaemiae]
MPSYFNAGHHTVLYQTAAYLRTLSTVDQVDTHEAGLLNVNWKALGDLLFQERYDVIAVVNDIDTVDCLTRFLYYARQLSPASKLVSFGRLSSMLPGFFANLDFDAVVTSGDCEAGVAAYVNALAHSGPNGGLPGVAVQVDDRWEPESEPGRFLPTAEWVLPDVREIPYDRYHQLYLEDAHKFCGIPLRRELVVPLARGCPIGCDYCDVHQLAGLKERRLPVPVVLNYIEWARSVMVFDYVAFYAPTFTLHKPWVRELASALVETNDSLPWKCSTTVHHLDEDLVTLMGRSGCIRISVGLETLEPAAHGGLPRAKRIHEEQFLQLGEWCGAAGVELNAFVIVGLPDTTAAGVQRTHEVVRAAGARFRPTMYTPFHLMLPTMSVEEIARFNRQMIHPESTGHGVDVEELYGFIFGADDQLTTVYNRIPQRA